MTGTERLPYPLTLVAARGLTVFPGMTAARDVNLVAVRHGRSTPSAGDDLLYACWRELAGGSWTVRAWRCETEPGPGYLAKPMNPRGTAIIAPGQYKRSHAAGLHKGRPALVQVAPVTVYRDADRDQLIELDPKTLDTGIHAVNIHDVASWGDLAGCIGLAPASMRELLDVYAMTAAAHGPGLTLTLVDG